MQYVKPDRSNFTPNFRKTPENEDLDIGWTEGSLSDGRPYRLECWAADQITNITVFVSKLGLERLEQKEALETWLEQEGLVQWRSDKRFAIAAPFRDASGNELLSINVVIGDENNTFTAGGPDLKPYDRTDPASSSK